MWLEKLDKKINKQTICVHGMHTFFYFSLLLVKRNSRVGDKVSHKAE